VGLGGQSKNNLKMPIDIKRFLVYSDDMTINKAAQALGRLGKGVSKTLSLEERKRRSDWAKQLNKMRRKK
jgi:hypothetical protein